MTRAIAVTTLLATICLGCAGESPSSPAEAPPQQPLQASAETEALEAARKLIEAGDLDEAKAKLTEIIAGNPRSAEARFLRGRLLADRGEHTAAIEDLNQAIWEDPYNLEAYLDRANCYRGTGNENQAMKDLDLVVERLTASGTDKLDEQGTKYLASAHLGRGLVYESRDELEQAIGEHSRAIELMPEKASLWATRGECYLRLREADKARSDVDRALALDPKGTATLNAKVLLEFDPDFGNPEVFGEWVEKLLSASPEGSPTYYLGLRRRGLWRLDHKQYAEGIADLEKYLETDRDPDMLNQIAWTLATCPEDAVRNGDKARELAEEARKLTSGKDLFCLGTLAAAHAELGEFAKAIELQEQALQDADYAKSEGEVAGKRLEGYRQGQPHRAP